MAHVGELLSRVAVVASGLLVILLVLIEYVLPPGGELLPALSFLAAILAPILAIVGFVLVKVSGKRASRVVVVALLFGCVALLWPLLFFLAYSSCPGGIC